MESATKNKLTKKTILYMVNKAFGEQYKEERVFINELTEGFFNAAYEINLPEQSVVLKIAPPVDALIMSYEKNIMKAEVDGLKLIAENTTVPVPKVLLYDSSKSICTSDYFFMEKIDGRSFSHLKADMSQEEQNKIFFKVGCMNREMNQMTSNGFGYLGQPIRAEVSWNETFLNMMEHIISDGERIEIKLDVSYEEVRRLLEGAADTLEEVKKPTFIHWDLWEGNIFVKDSRITGIIDFERALWGDPLMEYGFRRHSYTDPFIKGYGNDLRAESPVRALLYDMYLYLLMVIETKYRKYPDDWLYHFSLKHLKETIEELTALM